MINALKFSDLLRDLSKPFVKVSLTDEIIQRVRETAQNIIDRDYDAGRGFRTEKQISHDCLIGTIREAGIKLLTGGEFNNQLYDHTKRQTYCWDVTAHDFTLEVKPQSKTSKNFNFGSQVYKVLMNNAEANGFEMIVTCDVSEQNADNTYHVYPVSLITRDQFRTYCKQSQFKDKRGKPSYYYPENAPHFKLN